MVDLNEKDELGRPMWGFRYPNTHKHEWRIQEQFSTADVTHWACKFREFPNMWLCGGKVVTNNHFNNLTSDEAITLLREKLNNVSEEITISSKKLGELKAAARELSLNIDKLTPQLKLILLIEEL